MYTCRQNCEVHSNQTVGKLFGRKVVINVVKIIVKWMIITGLSVENAAFIDITTHKNKRKDVDRENF